MKSSSRHLPRFGRRLPRRAFAAAVFAASAAMVAATTLEIRNGAFYLDGRPSYSDIPNSPALGRLLNARFIQGVFDDRADRSRFDRFGRVFNPERNTDDLIAALPQWRAAGLRAFTVGLQGGGPCYTIANGSIDANPFSRDGSQIDEPTWSRLERLLDAADGLGMVVVVSVLYEGQIRRLADDDAVKRAVCLVARRLRESGRRNVILEPCNEHDNKTPFEIVSTDEGMAGLLDAAREAGGGIPVGCSPCGGHFLPQVAEHSDVVLLHGNGLSRNKLAQLLERARRHCPGKPILVNEDSPDVTHLDVCLRAGVSWGYYNNWTKQEPPCDWGIVPGEDVFFARRMAQAVGLVPATATNEYYLAGLEPEMQATYTSSTPMKSLLRANGFPPGRDGESMRFVRLASLYPERIDHVEFFVNGRIVDRVYDTPHAVHAMRNWSQGPLFGLGPGDEVHAVVHERDGRAIRVDPPTQPSPPAASDISPAPTDGHRDRGTSPASLPLARWRGVKVNIPLDARTPSYSDAGDSGVLNVETVWDESFWQAFVDDLAGNGFNLLSLWSLSPFPSLVRTPGFESVALDDVYAPLEPITGNSLSGRGMVPRTGRTRLVRRMTMDEKIAFWRRVMEYADAHGVAVMLYTWNVFTYGVNDPRIDETLDNEQTRRYVRSSVEALFRTYPLLRGIGVTSGENMSGNPGTDERWLRDTYGKAVETMRAEGRDVLFVHRTQMSSLETMRQVWDGFPMSLGFKYSYAHMYSAPRSEAADAFFARLRPDERVILTLRNDDRHLLSAWCDPRWAARYLDAALSDPRVEGFVIGSDNFVHLREFALRATSPALATRRHYLPFAVWGRLAAGLDCSPGFLTGEISRREGCPRDEAEVLLRAVRLVSGAIPVANCAFWLGADYRRYPEANCGLGERDGKGAVVYHGIRDWAKARSLPGAASASPGENPAAARAAASALRDDCRAALELLARCKTPGTLRDDAVSMARFGLFTAETLDAAAALASGDAPERFLPAARRSVEAWRQYAADMRRRFLPQRMPRFRGIVVDFADLTRQAEDELEEFETAAMAESKQAPETSFPK